MAGRESPPIHSGDACQFRGRRDTAPIHHPPRDPMRRRPLLLLIVAILLAPLTVAGAAGARAAGVPAGLTPAGDGLVATVQDALTLTLDDGRTVRLIGLTGPAAEGNAADTGEGMATLASLVRGERVLLYFAGRAQDRYGRVLAHLVRGGFAADHRHRLAAA